MRPLLFFASAAEGATGVLLIVIPQVVVRALLGSEIGGPAVATSRVAGIALLALGVACWPGGETGGLRRALVGMLTYSLVVTLYLGRVALRGLTVGPFLWPAVVLHTGLTILLVRAFFKQEGT